MSERAKARVVIVDDHPVMRMGLSQLLKSSGQVEVCGEAGSVAEALAVIESADSVDLVVIDISLPDRSGLELIRDLKIMDARIRSLVVSSHDEKVYAERVLRAGGRGYIMKDRAPEQLIAAVEQVLAGGIFLSPMMTSRMMETLAGANAASPISGLTDRELEVFRAIGEGKSSRETAGALGVSIRTIDAHRTHIKEKLGLRDASELSYEAIRWRESQS
ncbi:MAG: response regulator transcription factor [Verrucomicrobiales bacterium]|jgi:DNA-binding NarL/FixJ family response regulator|nr:response regulator transcription factor [Verrucomicrobiales bacterium]